MFYTIKGANNEDADQMHRRICIFVVRIWRKTGFLTILTLSKNQM